MSELKPCPFCGSGWLYETMRNGYCDETPTMFCNSCKAVVTWEQVEEEGVNDETRTFVREHWNTRADTATLYEDGFYLHGRKFVPERTCELTLDGTKQYNNFISWDKYEDDSKYYLHFLDLCAERANEIQRDNEMKVFTNMCKSLDFVRVVRCKDCVYMSDDGLTKAWCNENCREVRPLDFCAWGEKAINE